MVAVFAAFFRHENAANIRGILDLRASMIIRFANIVVWRKETQKNCGRTSASHACVRSGFIGALVVLILAAGAIASFPARAGADTLTCEGLFDCAQLKQACGKGAFGALIYPDGHVWGVCVI